MKIYIIVMGLYAIGYAFVRWSAGRAMQRYIGWRFFLCLALMTLAVVVSPNATIYGFACILIFVATVRDRFDAVCRMVMMGVLAPTVRAKIIVGGLFLIEADTVDFLAVGLAIALLIHRRGDKERLLRGITAEDGAVVILFLALWIGVTRFPSLTITGRAGVEQFLLTPLPYLLLRRGLRTTEEVRTAGMAMAVATILTAFEALYESRTKWLPIHLMSQHINVGEYGLSMVFRGNLLRPMTSTGNPLGLAAVLVMGFIAALCSRRFFRSATRFRASLALLAVTLVLAQSRGNLIVLGVACVVLLALAGRKLLAGLIAGVSLATYEALVALAPHVPQIAAFLGLDQSAQFGGHFDYRGFLLQRGLQEAQKHPWLGTSMDDLMRNMLDLEQGQHIVDFVNTYLVIYLVSGLIGAVSFILLMLYAMQRLAWLPTRRNAELVSARALVTAAFVAIAIELSFMSYIAEVPMLLMLTFAASRTLRLQRGPMARKAAPAAEPAAARLAAA